MVLAKNITFDETDDDMMIWSCDHVETLISSRSSPPPSSSLRFSNRKTNSIDWCVNWMCDHREKIQRPKFRLSWWCRWWWWWHIILSCIALKFNPMLSIALNNSRKSLICSVSMNLKSKQPDDYNFVWMNESIHPWWLSMF